MSSNNFNFEILRRLHGEHPKKFLHHIGIEEKNPTDAFHHIYGRNKENPNLASIFNALPVENAPHLRFHGVIRAKADILSEELAKWLCGAILDAQRNDITFIKHKNITDTDFNFILEKWSVYSEETQKKLYGIFREKFSNRI